MSNPFVYGGTVAPEYFLGRSNETAKIFDSLKNSRSVSIVGPSRIGRSSLLSFIGANTKNHVSESCEIIFLTLHSPDCKTQSGLLRSILLPLTSSQKIAKDKKITLSEFQESISQSHKKIIIFIDEFDVARNNPVFTSELLETWASLIERKAITLFLVSTRSLFHITRSRKFASLFTLIELGEFTEEDSVKLIQKGIVCDLSFSQEDIKLMKKLGKRHPYKLQLAGQLIYNHKSNGWELNKKNKVNLKKEFEHQVLQVGLDVNNRIRNKLILAGEVIWDSIGPILKILGQSFLQGILRLDKEKINPSTEYVYGGAIILLALIVLKIGWAGFVNAIEPLIKK